MQILHFKFSNFLLIIFFTKNLKADNVVDLILKTGYPAEIHKIETADGYLLSLHRIPPRNTKENFNKKSVLIMHGLFNSAADYVLTGRQNSLGFILSDAGYDVWLGNARGTTNSKAHRILQPYQREFWDFSWPEIGKYDLPAIIDYILSLTNQTGLHYIGHSQGCTVFLVMLTVIPQYNSKILSANLMAPVAILQNPTPLYRFLASNLNQIELLITTLGMYEFLGTNSKIQIIGGTFCADGSSLQSLCIALITLAFGENLSQFNATLLPAVLQNAPAGSSYKQFLHYGQLIRSGIFQAYDYKSERNLKMYHQPVPIQYDLNLVNVPIKVFYGTSDLLLTKSDALNLVKKLGKNVVGVVELPGWNHIDFMYAIDVNELVYSKIIRMIRRYT